MNTCRVSSISRFLSSTVLPLTLALGMTALAGACKKAAPPASPSGENTSAATAPTSGDTIKIGTVGSMTGDQASFGISTQRGIELAIQQINAKGGVKGKKLTLVALDDRGNPEEAATAITRLITQDKVMAVLGEVASSRSIAMAPIAQQYKVPMITPSSTNPKVTELGDYIFRVCFIDPFQGTVMAKFASEQLKAKRVAVLRDIKNDYSVGLANFFSETFKKNGGEIVLDQSYSNGDIDFKAQLTAIRTKNPEAIFVPGYYTEVGLIARQARELGIKVPLLGGDGWDSPKLTEIGGEAINGSYFSNHYSTDNLDPKVQEFVTKYKEMFGGAVPEAFGALAYDATYVLVAAIEKAPTFNSADIRTVLAETKDFQGVTGKITLDANRNAIKSAVILKVEDGKFKYQTTVNP